MKKIAIISFVFFIISCSAFKGGKTESTLVVYKVIEERTFADSIWKEVDDLDVISDRESIGMELEAKENPFPAYYRLNIQDSISKLSYIEPSDVEDEFGYRNFAIPFSSGDTYKFTDESGVFVDLTKEITNTYLNIRDRTLKWSDGRKDSTIAGVPVRLKIGREDDAKIRAWIADELPSHLGLFDLDHEDGFVLAFELTKYNKGDFRRIYLKAEPQELNQKYVKPIEAPKFTRQVSEKQLEGFRKSTKNKKVDRMIKID